MPYTQAETDILAQEHPEILAIGANTRKVNTFTLVTPEITTGERSSRATILLTSGSIHN